MTDCTISAYSTDWNEILNMLKKIDKDTETQCGTGTAHRIYKVNNRNIQIIHKCNLDKDSMSKLKNEVYRTLVMYDRDTFTILDRNNKETSKMDLASAISYMEDI